VLDSEKWNYERVDKEGFMNPKIQSILMELRHALEKIYESRMQKAVLFGTCARFQEKDSDIDARVGL
jgi:predicted nucleotidyltransferase